MIMNNKQFWDFTSHIFYQGGKPIIQISDQGRVTKASKRTNMVTMLIVLLQLWGMANLLSPGMG